MANENIINWGLVASYWAPITEDADGNDVYGLPRKFRGNRAINFTQSGEMVKVYADGTVIYTGKPTTATKAPSNLPTSMKTF